MKKIVAVIAAIALAANVGVAQPVEGGRGRMSPEERQKMMQERQVKRDAALREKLSLSDAVAQKVDSVNAKYDKQQMELMRPENRGSDREARRSQMENIQKAREAEVKAQLSEEQGRQYDKWLEEQRREPRGGMGNRRGGAGRPDGSSGASVMR